MGLLDWHEDEGELFPDYDCSTKPNVKLTQMGGPSSSLRSHSSKGSSSSSIDSSASTATDASSSQAKTAPSGGRKSKHRHRPSFDLFGDDSELQSAEAHISFCMVCLKGCDIH